MAKRSARATARARQTQGRRYSVDASVFVNAFNPHEPGHAASLAALTAIQERGDPMIVPALLLTEVASAVARANNDTAGAIEYVDAIAGLPNVTLVTLTPALARQAVDLAATHRLRGADAVYVAVSLRYGTALVTRDDEQRKRGAAAVTCLTPEEALT